MTTLFQIDQQANDRLLLSEAERKRDAIDFAVRRFAPQLTGKEDDVTVMHLYSTNASLRKEIRSLTGTRTILVEHCLTDTRRLKIHEMTQEGMFLTLPKEADIVATRTALNKRVEWLAAGLKAQVIVLPEAAEYMTARLKKQRVLIIVGGEQAKL